jgi:hypothetical protein
MWWCSTRSPSRECTLFGTLDNLRISYPSRNSPRGPGNKKSTRCLNQYLVKFVRSSPLSHSVLVKMRSYISGIVGLAPQSPAPPRPPNLSSKSSQDIEAQSVCGETTESTTAICCNPRASVVRRRLRTSATGTTNGCAFQQKWWCGAWLRAII